MRHSRRNAIRCLAGVGLGALFGNLRAQEQYPSRPIRIVVPVAPGYATDGLARILAEALRKRTGAQIIVENRAGGAAGTVGTEYVARAEPDGYTLLFTSQAPLGVNKLLYRKLGYDPLALTPISLMAESANLLLVRAESPYQTLDALINAAKADPGKLTYGSGGVGTTSHLGAELFKSRTGTDILHVPFKGAAATATGLMGGSIDMYFGEVGASLPHIKSGRLRALGVGTPKRHPLLPDVPPISDTLPGFTSTVWYGLVAPPATPASVVSTLGTWVVEVMKEPSMQERLQGMGGRAVGMPPEQFAAFMKSDFAYWQKVVAEAHIPAM